MRNFKFKSILLAVILLIEIVIFGVAYFFGNSGIKQLKLAKAQNQLLFQEINKLKGEVERLENKFQEWEADNFYQEKIARERLHMSKSGEQIYYLS